jgi:ABC-2 type transport system permease protein
MNHRGFVAFARLELADALRSRWVLFSAFLYCGLAMSFVWLGLSESRVLGFTGLTRALMNVTSAVVLACPLLVLIATHSAIVRARSSGFCELMLTLPVRRSTWFNAVLCARLAILIGPFILLIGACLLAAAVRGGEAELLWLSVKSLSVCAALVFSFVGMGLMISSLCHTTERALVAALLVFVTTAALHDVLLISVLLRSTLSPWLVFALAALNPIEAARVGILASADPELSVLGPVGFWLANGLGPANAYALAVVWPTVIGLVTALVAQRRTRRMDLIL